MVVAMLKARPTAGHWVYAEEECKGVIFLALTLIFKIFNLLKFFS